MQNLIRLGNIGCVVFFQRFSQMFRYSTLAFVGWLVVVLLPLAKHCKTIITELMHVLRYIF